MNSDRQVIENFIQTEAFRMLKEGEGVFNHPFIDPGAGYEYNLWDWDSYFSALALMSICEHFKSDKGFDYEALRSRVIRHAKGNILNFFDLQHEDGFIPMVTTAHGLFSDFLSKAHRAGEAVNQHKPFLCQGTYNVSEYSNDFDWFRIEPLLRYLNFYETQQYHAISGLFFWRNDLMIGMDNNPTVYGRNDDSVADIYLNCFLVGEYEAIAKLLEARGDVRAKEYRAKWTALKNAIRAEMYDKRDGLYYSLDLQVTTHKTEFFNHGIGAFWHGIPQKIRIWACFLPMMYGISTASENERMVSQHYWDESFLSPYGIRTLSSDERMYNTENSSNPSNWLGAIWIVANFCVYSGLRKCGFEKEADDLTERTIQLLAKDIRENGSMAESYVPETGKRMMWGGFLNWDCLVIAMMDKK